MRFLITLLFLFSSLSAQELYKYKGEDGEWIFSDRPPPDQREVEVRGLETGPGSSSVGVAYRVIDRSVQLFATNDYHAPVQLQLQIKLLRGLEYPNDTTASGWVLPARSELVLFDLPMTEVQAPALEYEYRFLIGDPDAEHRPPEPYRVPFAVATRHPVSQAYPDASTHTTADSQFAIDFAMPIGTDIVAARGGVVFEVKGNNRTAGLDRMRDIDKANVVSILHDDGTYATYAHLDWNAIRVRPGDVVARGQRIANSGNTGFSSGPHLHFAVLRNTGMNIESINVEFEGPGGTAVRAVSGRELTAY